MDIHDIWQKNEYLGKYGTGWPMEEIKEENPEQNEKKYRQRILCVCERDIL